MSEDALAEVVWGVLVAADADENLSVVAHAVARNVREHEAGIAAAVEALADEWGEMDDNGDHPHGEYADDIRAALTSAGASEALAKRDARVRERISDAILAERSSDGLTFRDEVLTIAAHIAREGGPPRVYECLACRDGETLPLGWTCSGCDRIGVREAGGHR